MHDDQKLKAALAKLFPEKVYFTIWGGNGNWRVGLWWIDKHSCNGFGKEVLDTELLHLCWCVEEGFTNSEKEAYHNELWEAVDDARMWLYHATWQQRVRALCAVKGVEI